MREEGYYWVKLDHRTEWEIALWNKEGYWSVPGFTMQKENFDEIDERRIIRPAPEDVIPCTDPKCEYTGECQASFFTNTKCKRNPPSEDWVRSQIPSHLKTGNK